jgi:hypothetical protein
MGAQRSGAATDRAAKEKAPLEKGRADHGWMRWMRAPDNVNVCLYTVTSYRD